jgi:hypothetical protein
MSCMNADIASWDYVIVTRRLYNLDFNSLFIVSQSSRSILWQSFEAMNALSLVWIAWKFYSSFDVVFIVLGLAMFAWSTISAKMELVRVICYVLF